jgi:DNA-binding HxlR family transcriptional regulator
MTRVLAKRFGCATEFTLEVLGGKWKTIILGYLKERDLRYGELRAMLPKLSDKVLTERLRELEKAGLITHGKSSLYGLTERGHSLRRVLTELYTWGEAQAGAYGVVYDQPLSKLGSPAVSRGG